MLEYYTDICVRTDYYTEVCVQILHGYMCKNRILPRLHVLQAHVFIHNANWFIERKSICQKFASQTANLCTIYTKSIFLVHSRNLDIYIDVQNVR